MQSTLLHLPKIGPAVIFAGFALLALTFTGGVVVGKIVFQPRTEVAQEQTSPIPASDSETSTNVTGVPPVPDTTEPPTVTPAPAPAPTPTPPPAPTKVKVTAENIDSLRISNKRLIVTENGVEKETDATDSDVTSFAVAPAKDKFAFVESPGPSLTFARDLYEYRLTGEKVALVTQPGNAYAINYLLYSPDGKYLAFSHTMSLKIATLPSGNIQTVDESSDMLKPVEWQSNIRVKTETTIIGASLTKVFEADANGIFAEVSP